MKKTTDFDPALIRLAMHDPTAQAVLTEYLQNDQTIEQTLTQLALALADTKRKLFDMLVKMHQVRGIYP